LAYPKLDDADITYDRRTHLWELVTRRPEDRDLIVRAPTGETIPEHSQDGWTLTARRSDL
jgi:hypothetical protein